MPDHTLTVNPFQNVRRERRRHVLHRLFPATHTLVLSKPQSLGRTTWPDDAAMSSRHAEATVDGDQLRIRDLGSKNGTWWCGVRVDEAVLRDGDVVRLGNSLFLFRLEPVELVDAVVPTLIGASPAMRHLRADLTRAAPTKATVLLRGETGTGKTLAARALHTLSQRRGPFVHVNCAAIADGLAESTLFGHKAGAFTGARDESEGFFRGAHRGTLFLDEVGLLSASSQARLLVALESGQVTPLGSTTPIPVDVRVVVATNEDIEDTSRFRKDLYGRLAELTVKLPPLRERKEDVLPLLARALGKHAPPLTPDAADLLLRWSWPHNVREVEKLATELAIRGEGLRALGAELLLDRFVAAPLPADTGDRSAAPGERVDGPPDRDTLVGLLEKAGGNVTELARQVGRSTKQVYRWCKQYGLDPEQFRR